MVSYPQSNPSNKTSSMPTIYMVLYIPSTFFNFHPCFFTHKQSNDWRSNKHNIYGYLSKSETRNQSGTEIQKQETTSPFPSLEVQGFLPSNHSFCALDTQISGASREINFPGICEVQILRQRMLKHVPATERP